MLINWLWVNQKGDCSGWAQPNQVSFLKEYQRSERHSPTSFERKLTAVFETRELCGKDLCIASSRRVRFPVDSVMVLQQNDSAKDQKAWRLKSSVPLPLHTDISEMASTCRAAQFFTLQNPGSQCSCSKVSLFMNKMTGQGLEMNFNRSLSVDYGIDWGLQSSLKRLYSLCLI